MMAGVLLILPLLFSNVICANSKISLAFVIDNSGSMGDDIDAVKEKANAIFDAVLNNKDSPIDNFVLVTFNDPDVGEAITTRDQDTFKQALNNIEVAGGGDCPENSMTGIESTIEASLPGSHLYVFTDASAKDYGKFDLVQTMTKIKLVKITFILTGRCDSNEKEIGESVYYDLAKESSGQVFYLGKSDVGDILDYVKESVKGKNIQLFSGTAKSKQEISFTADSSIRDLIISVSGSEAKIEEVSDFEGVKAQTEAIADLSAVAIVKVHNAKPGLYTLKVSCKSSATVVITGILV